MFSKRPTDVDEVKTAKSKIFVKVEVLPFQREINIRKEIFSRFMLIGSSFKELMIENRILIDFEMFFFSFRNVLT